MKKALSGFHAVSLAARPEILSAGVGPTPRLPWTDYPPRAGWLLHIYSYAGEIRYDDNTYDFRSGWASLIPAQKGWREVWPVPSSHHVYARFNLADPPGSPRVRFPVVWDLAERADRFRQRFRSSVSHLGEDRLWAEVGLWELLFELGDVCEKHLPAQDDHMPSAVREALRYIETALCDPITAEDVAATVGMSYSHLASLFRKHVGMGIASCVRRRKMAAAEELLCNSDMPVKSISAQIGMTDLQHFNKLVRKTFGLSPRGLRRRAMQGD